jgi:hypothetical protein
VTANWPDRLDEILGGDHAVALAYVTPASGVVLSPVSNFGTRDRQAGTVTVNSSIGAWKKLDRIRRNPSVALVFHTREHARSRRPEYVLVQGRASLSPFTDRAWLDAHREEWERFTGGMREFGPLWGRWLSVYHWRVGIEVAVERVVTWPDLRCSGNPEVLGAPLPSEPPAPQRPPARGTAPRVNHARAAASARRLPNLLLGWVGTDGLPVVVPARVAGAEQGGIAIEAPWEIVPSGGRRAGLTAHWFSRHVLGQRQRIYTGWLEAESRERRLVYAPHTEAAYRLPPSKLLYKLVVGLFTRLRLRGARRAGLLAG